MGSHEQNGFDVKIFLQPLIMRNYRFCLKASPAVYNIHFADITQTVSNSRPFGACT